MWVGVRRQRQTGDNIMKTVLFVCIGNSCRSQMAEAFFNRYAPQGYRAESAGTAPADVVSSNAIAVMQELGIDICGQRPKGLPEEMLKHANRVILMGCQSDMCPAKYNRKLEEWDIEDPVGKDLDFFRKTRDHIQQKVLELVDRFKAKNQEVSV